MSAPKYLCETPDNKCGHTVPEATRKSLHDWREEKGPDELYIVRSECSLGYEVLQRYGNYCVIRDEGQREN